MREIKFRGKWTYNNEWVFGSLVIDKDENTMIGSGGFVDVLRDTVGQFTGLKDGNGIGIYEGDLLRWKPESEWDIENFTAFEVFFHDGNMSHNSNIGWSMGRFHHQGSICGGIIWDFKPKTTCKMIICGNIHDNPELIRR